MRPYLRLRCVKLFFHKIWWKKLGKLKGMSFIDLWASLARKIWWRRTHIMGPLDSIGTFKITLKGASWPKTWPCQLCKILYVTQMNLPSTLCQRRFSLCKFLEDLYQITIKCVCEAPIQFTSNYNTLLQALWDKFLIGFFN